MPTIRAKQRVEEAQTRPIPACKKAIQCPSDDLFASPTTSLIRRLQLEQGQFFGQNALEMYQCLQQTFGKELVYLQDAYHVAYPKEAETKTDPPSYALLGKRFPEIDRTLTGIAALTWIYLNDYDSFTHNQRDDKLSKHSFELLRYYFNKSLQDFRNYEALGTLILMQMMNDLGKSTQLVKDLKDRLPNSDRAAEMSHDMIMSVVLSKASDLLPSLSGLSEESYEMVKKLTTLSANFSLAQFIQGECQEVALEALTEEPYTSEELDMKFMELILDMCGAAGHVNHEGACTMTESVFKSMMKGIEMSKGVAQRKLSTNQAYREMLEFRLDLCYPDGRPVNLMDITHPWVYAMARLLCMGRVILRDDAALYQKVFESLDWKIRGQLARNLYLRQATLQRMPKPSRYDLLCGIQVTYIPALLALARRQEQVLTGLFTFLAHAQQIKLRSGHRSSVPKAAKIVIAERDVRKFANKVKIQKMGFAFDRKQMPPVQIVKRK